MGGITPISIEPHARYMLCRGMLGVQARSGVVLVCGLLPAIFTNLVSAHCNTCSRNHLSIKSLSLHSLAGIMLWIDASPHRCGLSLPPEYVQSVH